MQSTVITGATHTLAEEQDHRIVELKKTVVEMMEVLAEFQRLDKATELGTETRAHKACDRVLAKYVQHKKEDVNCTCCGGTSLILHGDDEFKCPCCEENQGKEF